mmetsp:Transcript_32564/g.87423  ORF Transcript_32564/g.87423 Transcript_32564/m.87423 type:complete len:108 (-) Transcript_32564:31-354(-)
MRVRPPLRSTGLQPETIVKQAKQMRGGSLHKTLQRRDSVVPCGFAAGLVLPGYSVGLLSEPPQGFQSPFVFHLSALPSSHSVRTPQAGVPYTYVGGLLTSALAKRSY